MEHTAQKLKSTYFGKAQPQKTEGGHSVLYSHLKEGYGGDEASCICTEKGQEKDTVSSSKKENSVNNKKKRRSPSGAQTLEQFHKDSAFLDTLK